MPDSSAAANGGIADCGSSGWKCRGQPADYAVYQLVVTRPNANLRQPDNVRGEPDAAAGQVLTTAEPTSAPAGQSRHRLAGVDPRIIRPATSAAAYLGPDRGNQGFYLLGLAGHTSRAPRRPARRCTASEMTFTISPAPTGGRVRAADPAAAAAGHPGMPPQPNSALPNYNPYVTVDYLDNVADNYAAAVGVNGPNDPPRHADRRSALRTGKSQPYASAFTLRRAMQTRPVPGRPAAAHLLPPQRP